VIALFDEYQSKENAKHVLRSMKENARQGFWNGSTTPFGYRTFEVERRGARIKKRLEIDEVEAEQVRLIFKLLQGGHGPLGVKSIATWLNERGYRTRRGGLWGLGTVHKLVTNPVYGGRWRFNTIEARTGKRKSDAEHIYADAPTIIYRIEVDQGTIRIMGRKDVLEQAVANGGQITPSVRTCVQKWRTGEDSNS